MDIIGIGWKLMQNASKIDRALKLAGPVIDKAKSSPDLQPALKDAFVQFRRAWNVVSPIVDEFMKVDSELVPLMLELASIFTPPAVPTSQPTTAPVHDYDVKWIQRTLKQDLGDKALPKYGIDGDYQDETREWVRKFQRKHPECGTPDGWVGPQTAAVMEAINPPWGPRT